MSGIVGIYYPDRQTVQPETLKRMVDTLIHRGPDGSKLWNTNNIGLGHRMLWTTPESLHEELPFVDQGNDLAITADARIDNREELIPQLEFDGLPPNKIADSQIILAAYRKWGEDCPNKLLGDFAFAIWDGQKQQLFCARDHFGVKPLYYYYKSNFGFVFASEIKAIITLPDVPVQINEVRIGDYLTYTLEDTAITSYQNIWRLPPAHSLTINYQNELKLSRYWTLEPGAEIKFKSDLEYAEKFREIFTEAVKCRLRSAFPIGSHLSGGLDSSSVTCVARDLLQQQGDKLYTFSNVFDSVPECNEREYIETVIAQGGVIPNFIHADQTGPLSEWSEFFKYADESLIGNCYLIWGLNRATKKAGVRIALNGFDGDTTVSHGVLRLTELANSGQWKNFINEGTALAKNFKKPTYLVLRSYGLDTLKRLAKKGQWLAFIEAVNTISQHVKIPPHKLIFNYGLKALVPERIKQIWRRMYHSQSSTPNSFSLVNFDFAQRINLQQRIDHFEREEPSTVKEHHWQKLTSGATSIALEGMDIFSAAFGIEYRHPFMDKRLIEYCLALPSEQKLNQGWSRLVLRRAMEGILPLEIQWRGDKSDLSMSFYKSIFKFNREIIKDIMLKKSDQADNFINRDQLQEIYINLISKNRLKENTISLIWTSITLNLWLEKFKI